MALMNDGEQEVWIRQRDDCMADCYCYRSSGRGKQG